MPALLAWLQENLLFFSGDSGIALVTAMCQHSSLASSITATQWQNSIDSASQVKPCSGLQGQLRMCSLLFKIYPVWARHSLSWVLTSYVTLEVISIHFNSTSESINQAACCAAKLTLSEYCNIRCISVWQEFSSADSILYSAPWSQHIRAAGRWC